jgi:hypothetical protein
LKEIRKDAEIKELKTQFEYFQKEYKERKTIFNIGNKVAYDTIETTNKKNEHLD